MTPDLVLIACLVVLVPAYQLWRSLKRRGAPKASKLRNYLRTIVMALLLMVPVLAVWIYRGRSWAALGLGLPLAGMIGLGIAVIGLAAMAPGMRRMKAADGRPPAALDLLPTTRTELAGFVIMSLLIGFSWEVLYRGYLLWALSPSLGTPLAVLVAAAAYGVAHGYKDVKQFAGSLVSALIFTLAYVATHSLWWLMVIHAGLPFLMLLVKPPPGPATAAEPTPA
ncbi:CPBP family intramembrane glutamic endopeptidase [Phenylobacterium sp.]|jgi:membrane protease YdiL (CAAX protease family)|uniref:CPBP family intramembrane glutamic endopeptidase n=1 Tax=Phenylobacterium sp. TaxID=1871053 RepID=UPI002E33EC7A|nr:CPBP family intramembrane glutamic endopeptidase [Phenylobacterium sp.]HEX3365488.1 CPBP family intramembrane glutamic endopeptidase [Phenylobacterium sp.]